jgi:rhodanese-related sulfurtransferase
MKNVEGMIEDAKKSLPNVTPTPPGLKPSSSVYDLKSRLEWGEPGLTILDVRDREQFNKGRITGAESMPLEYLATRAQSALHPIRDIYVYGESDQQTAEAASQLRGAGFVNVAELKGGLAAWKAAAGPTEGSEEQGGHLTPAAFNLFARLDHHRKTQHLVFER